MRSDSVTPASYTYTPNGKRESLTDANGSTARMTYDGLDRQARWIFPSKTLRFAVNEADYEEYGYDPNGNRTKLRKRDGSEIGFHYDALNRLSAKIVPERDGLTPAQTRDVHYEYDNRGLMTAASFGAPGYDMVRTWYDGFGQPATVLSYMSGQPRYLNHLYDADGNREHLIHTNDNARFRFNYDGLGRMTAILDKADYSSPDDLVVRYFYRPQGQRHVALSGSGSAGLSTGYYYDSVQRLSAIANDLAAPGADWSIELAYNPAGQIVRRDLSHNSYAWTEARSDSRYYETNGLNQYTQVGPNPYTYDPNGNLTSDGITTYTYDVENRLVAASNGGAVWPASGTAVAASGPGPTRPGPSGGILPHPARRDPVRLLVADPALRQPLRRLAPLEHLELRLDRVRKLLFRRAERRLRPPPAALPGARPIKLLDLDRLGDGRPRQVLGRRGDHFGIERLRHRIDQQAVVARQPLFPHPCPALREVRVAEPPPVEGRGREADLLGGVPDPEAGRQPGEEVRLHARRPPPFAGPDDLRPLPPGPANEQRPGIGRRLAGPGRPRPAAGEDRPPLRLHSSPPPVPRPDPVGGERRIALTQLIGRAMIHPRHPRRQPHIRRPRHRGQEPPPPPARHVRLMRHRTPPRRSLQSSRARPGIHLNLLILPHFHIRKNPIFLRLSSGKAARNARLYFEAPRGRPPFEAAEPPDSSPSRPIEGPPKTASRASSGGSATSPSGYNPCVR